MIVALAIVLFLPFLLGIGLYLQSSLLLTEQSVFSVLFTSKWFPMVGQFGLLGFILSSLMVTVLSLLIAGPVCLLTAIHLTQYARKWVLGIMHPVYPPDQPILPACFASGNFAAKRFWTWNIKTKPAVC
jgi:phosphate transport system permease protein